MIDYIKKVADYESAALPTELGWLAFVYNNLRAMDEIGFGLCAGTVHCSFILSSALDSAHLE
jgi:hypothetical protein